MYITLKKRRDFLRLAAGSFVKTPYFLLQMRPQPDEMADIVRIGFTASKKIGNAVVRNRAKRRLRQVVFLSQQMLKPGMDYVLIARAETTISAPFSVMMKKFQSLVA